MEATQHSTSQLSFLIWEIEFTYSKPRPGTIRFQLKLCNELKPMQQDLDKTRKCLKILGCDDKGMGSEGGAVWRISPLPGPVQDTREDYYPGVRLTWPQCGGQWSYIIRRLLSLNKSGASSSRVNWSTKIVGRFSGDLYRSISRYRKCGNLHELVGNRWLVEGGETEDRERETGGTPAGQH